MYDVLALCRRAKKFSCSIPFRFRDHCSPPNRASAKIPVRALIRNCGLKTPLVLVLSCCFYIMLSGCGGIVVNRSATGTLQVQPGSVAFGSVPVGQTATATISVQNSGSAPIQVSQINPEGEAFSVTGQSSLPISLAAGSAYSLNVTFTPTAAGAATGQLAITSNSSTTPTAVVDLSGTGEVANPAQGNGVLNGLSCSAASMTGAGSDVCTVTVSAAAGTNGLGVSLSSSSTAVTVPASVAIPAGATSASFPATVMSVTSPQTVNLTAVAGGVTETYTLTLSAAVPQLLLSASGLNFGNVIVGTPSTQVVTLTSSGTAPLTISAAVVTGTGFSASGLNSPLTLNPGQTTALTVEFDPVIAGAATGTLTLTSNSSTGSTSTIGLSGTGEPQPGTLSGISCSAGSMTGAGTDVCTVALTAPAGTSGLTVNLSSGSSAVTVPASVIVPSGAASAIFIATVSAVNTAQTVTLTATAGSVTETYGLALNAVTAGLSLSASSLNFGDVVVDNSAMQSVILTSSGTAPLTINTGSVTGAGFRMSGLSFPLTLNPGQTATVAVAFEPATAGAATGVLAFSSNASGTGTAAISLSGTGESGPGVLGGLTCSSAAVTGAQTDTCTVTLTAAAPSSGLNISLSSNNAAVTVPSSVTVPAGATSASFTATIASVTSAQTIALTASAGGVTVVYAINLNAAAPALTLSTTSIAFGDVNLNASATQSVTITSSGTAPVTLSAGSVTGSGFSISGVSFPVTLSVGQSAHLNIEFDPTTAGAVIGAVTLTSNASPSTATITLSGTGATVSYEVDLTWNAPTSSTDPVAGYNVYRATSSSSSYQLLNPSVSASTSYRDTSVQDNTSYTYYVESVDVEGNQSAPSNTYTVDIP